MLNSGSLNILQVWVLYILSKSANFRRIDIVQEIAICTLQYKTNLCATNAIPAMAQQCANWETCMNRDPTIVGRAKVGAEMIAEVVNGFVEPISWKALVSISSKENDDFTDHMDPFL